MQTAALLVQRLFEETQGEASAASETGWEGVDCGVVVDASGNSLLHWAAAHARVDAVSQLMKRGVNADASRRNYVGETPLMRAVMSFAAYESQNMDSLLALLADSLPVADSSGRTVLHHAALSAAVRGRVFAARYYTDCIAKFLTSGDSHLDAQARESFVNSSDINGDTALISAARIGDLNIVESLISQMVARVDVQNCAGLVAADFGLNSDLLACPNFTTNGASWPEIHDERESSQTPPPSRSGSGTSNSASSLKGKVNHQTLVTPPSSSASHINSGPVGSLTSAIQTESQLPASATDFSRLCQTSLNTIQSTINNLHQMYMNTISVHISKLNDIESEVNSLSKHHSALEREKTVLLQNKRKLQQKLDGGVVGGAHKRLVKLRRRLEREEGRVTICRAAVRELNEKTGVMLLSTVATGSIQSRKQVKAMEASKTRVTSPVTDTASVHASDSSTATSVSPTPKIEPTRCDEGGVTIDCIDVVQPVSDLKLAPISSNDESIFAFIKANAVEEDQLLAEIARVRKLLNEGGEKEQTCKLMFSIGCNVSLEHVDKVIDPLLEWMEDRNIEMEEL